MSSSVAGWFRLTSTLPSLSGWFKVSLVCAPLGSLSSSLVDSLLMWATASSSPELRSITSAWREEPGEKRKGGQYIVHFLKVRHTS